MKNAIVVTHSPGRMGNILVQLSHIAAFCIEYDKPLYALTLSDVGSVFEHSYGSLGKMPLTEDIQPALHHQKINRTTKDKIIRKLRRLFIRSRTTSSSYGSILGTVNLAGNKHTLDLESIEFLNFVEKHHFTALSGWRFRAPNLVLKHADKIREVFQFKQKYNLAAEETLKPLLNAKTVVGVHIRLGDYRKTNYYYSLESYTQLMESLQQIVENPVFVVCSDEDVHNDIPESLSCIFPRSEPIVDLLCLSKCHLLVGPPSTFSGWAAFISNIPHHRFQADNSALKLDSFITNRPIDGPCQNPVTVSLSEISKHS